MLFYEESLCFLLDDAVSRTFLKKINTTRFLWSVLFMDDLLKLIYFKILYIAFRFYYPSLVHK